MGLSDPRTTAGQQSTEKSRKTMWWW